MNSPRMLGETLSLFVPESHDSANECVYIYPRGGCEPSDSDEWPGESKPNQRQTVLL